MKVTVRLFAGLRERAGSAAVELDPAAAGALADDRRGVAVLVRELADPHPDRDRRRHGPAAHASRCDSDR